MKLPRNIKLFINYFLGPVLLLWLSFSVYREIRQQPDLERTWQLIRTSFGLEKWLVLAAVVLLMVVNWSLEAWKWKLSVRPVQPVPFGRALQAVLSGVSFSVSTPNRIGEYLGRVLYMDEGNRLRTISLTIVGSISQLIITLVAGLAGLLWMQERLTASGLISGMWMKVILWGVAAVTAVILLFYFRLAGLVRWADRLPGRQRFVYLVQALEQFDASILWRLLSLSGLRYMVFLVQYFLVFRLFEVNLPFVETCWAVSVTFLVMAVIPTIAIAELAQRGKVSLAVVGLFSANELGITFGTAAIWFINLIVPAIIGSLLIVRIRKIFKAQHENPVT